MRVTVEKDNGETEVFQHLTDVYIAYRQQERVADKDNLAIVLKTSSRSYSWGSEIRELVKEVQQSLNELQDFLRGQRNGNPS